MPLIKEKTPYALAVSIGFFFVALGVYSLLWYFTIGSTGHSDTLLPSIASFAFGVILINVSLPVFIPLERKHLGEIDTCPRCGAIVKEEFTHCEKCKQELSP